MGIDQNAYRKIQRRKQQIKHELRQNDVAIDILRYKNFNLAMELYSLLNSLESVFNERNSTTCSKHTPRIINKTTRTYQKGTIVCSKCGLKLQDPIIIGNV